MDFISREDIKKNAFENNLKTTMRYRAPGFPAGEMDIVLKGGNAIPSIFTREMIDRVVALPEGEMTAPADIEKFMKQVSVSVAVGMADYPTVYQYIYDEIVNTAFPKKVDVQDFIGMQAAFGIVNDGEGVPQAGFKFKMLDSVSFRTYATSYSITRKWVQFNEFWKVPQVSKALGIAHNAILDHIHLSPIIKYSYTGKSATAKNTTGSTALETVYLSLRDGLKDALQRTTSNGFRVRPTIALCNSATAMDVQAAVNGLLQKGTQLAGLGQIQTVLSYDGWDGEINGIKYSFEAPKDNEVYLIMPKLTFKALVKEDITHLEQRGNILTLSEVDVVETFTRAVVAEVAHTVQKVTIA